MKTRVIVALAAMAICGAIWSIYRTLNPPPVPMKVGVFRYYGEVACQKVQETINSGGDIALWRPRFSVPSARVDALMAGFEAAAKKSGLPLLPIEQDLVSTQSEFADIDAFPIGRVRLSEFLYKHKDASILVLVAGNPGLAELSPSDIPSPCPKIFLIQIDGLPLPKSVLNSPLLAGAIVPKRELPTNNPQTDAERFEAYYEYIAPQ